MYPYIDGIGREVIIKEAPERIISLVPSQTALLAYLGLSVRIAGITDYCIEPDGLFNMAAKIGGTKNISINKIRELQPDLIVGNKEENPKSLIEKLAAEFPVYITDVRDYNSALEMIKDIGLITGKKEESEALINTIISKFVELPVPKSIQRAAYFIWRKPYMVASANTFISSMMEFCGFNNVFLPAETNYPVLTEEMLVEKQPEVILLSSEPYNFGDEHITEFQNMMPDTKVLLVNGQYFSWYGSKMVESPYYFTKMISNNF